MTKTKLPTMHCFYGVRHAKGPCNACTGHVKIYIKHLVKSNTCIVNTLEAFYKAAKEHLLTQKSKPGKCLTSVRHIILQTDYQIGQKSQH